MSRISVLLLLAVVMLSGCATQKHGISRETAEQVFQYPKSIILMRPEQVSLYTNGYRIGWDSCVEHGGFGGGSEAYRKMPHSLTSAELEVWEQGLIRGEVDAELTTQDLDLTKSISNHPPVSTRN